MFATLLVDNITRSSTFTKDIVMPLCQMWTYSSWMHGSGSFWVTIAIISMALCILPQPSLNYI